MDETKTSDNSIIMVESDRIPLSTLIETYHNWGVMTNLHHLMMGHHDTMSVQTVDDNYPAFVWECPNGPCDNVSTKVSSLATWIPNEERASERLITCMKTIPGFLISDVIMALNWADSEVVHTNESVRIKETHFGFLEIR